MKIIFAGTPSFAAILLQTLLQSSHQVVAVYTQADKPAGRGLKLTLSPVKELALAHHLPISQPPSLQDPKEQTILAKWNADIMVVAAYGMLLPEAVLHIPRLGCINIHSSLLPRWRGAAPIQHAILAGDKITGVSIMQMEQGLDTGPVLLQQIYTLREDETSQSLHDQLAELGAAALIETLDRLNKNQITPIPQDNQLATYANKITKEEARLDWTQKAIELERKVRAFNPAPVAFTNWQQQPLRIWQAKAISMNYHHSPGTIVSASHHGMDIATSEGVLRLLRIQLPGGKIITISDFYNAKHDQLIVGQHLA
ncbi:MAG: methionyl-tRNA formyltransferase [Gammaproteobacteria bacterium RIFCSPHIGHO2_12_FULL_37_34]|nr:MAG: methionyl-tRNA formyltransferase [Gammaproteobacteria bacterium RIFCSPHIGHO2_12_FULL_37_34]